MFMKVVIALETPFTLTGNISEHTVQGCVPKPIPKMKRKRERPAKQNNLATIGEKEVIKGRGKSTRGPGQEVETDLGEGEQEVGEGHEEGGFKHEFSPAVEARDLHGDSLANNEDEYQDRH